MSDEYLDPSGSTGAFHAFQTAQPAEAESSSKLPLIIGAAVAAVAVIGLVAWLALG